MKNLFKNVVRSFSKNKISLLGLSFLVFFGVGSFCVLSNTTTNITNEYTSVASKGAMHDLIISELYNIGTPTFQDNNSGIIATATGTDPFLSYDFNSVKSFFSSRSNLGNFKSIFSFFALNAVYLHRAMVSRVVRLEKGIG